MPYFQLFKCLHPHPKTAAFIKAPEPSWRGGRSKMFWGISQTYTSSSLGQGLAVLQQCPKQIVPKGLSVPLHWHGSAQGYGLVSWLTWRTRSSFPSSCFQEAEEVLTTFREFGEDVGYHLHVMIHRSTLEIPFI